MIRPKPLQAGDKIGIVAPSRKVSNDDLQEAISLINQWGYEVALGDNIFDAHHQFAGSDETRVRDFEQMIADTSVKAILCARGGYGTVRLLEKLNAESIRQNPKWVIGYSDITVLHSYFNKVIGCETIHGSMPINCLPETSGNSTWQKLRKLLSGQIPEYSFPPHEFNRIGSTSGVLVGGNLSVLFSLRGSFCDIDTDNRILFIEDLDEYLYHIDRMMMNLRISGKLKKLKGLIVGSMSDMKDNAVPFGKSAYEIIFDAVSDYTYPVMFNFPAGHCEPNIPVVFGREVILNVTEVNAELKY